jgi:hypothetical protein
VSAGRSVLVLAAGMLFGLVVLLAFRVSSETGKSLAASFVDVPGELQRLLTGLPGRAEGALTAGRQAFDAKQAEIEQFLRQAEQPS